MTFADKLKELRERATPGNLTLENFNADDLNSPNRFDGPVVIYSNEDCETHPVADFSCNHTCRDADEANANAALFAFLANHAAEIEALVRAAELALTHAKFKEEADKNEDIYMRAATLGGMVLSVMDALQPALAALKDK
jgi:hypothetical protein